MLIELAALFTIISGALLIAAYTIGLTKKWIAPPWRPSLRKWMQEEIITLLKNDDTPVAVYAHEAREAAVQAAEASKEAKEEAYDLHEDVRAIRSDITELHSYVRKTNEILVVHISESSRRYVEDHGKPHVSD